MIAESTQNLSGVYHPRNPFNSPLWKLFHHHFQDFLKDYPEKFEKTYGYFRPVIKEAVNEYLVCGDLKQGFARVKCEDCDHEFLLAFSCKGRLICPSCSAKKAIKFGEHLLENVLYPVPHRQYVFSIPKMIRIYFKHDRKLLTKLCRCAYDSMLEFFCTEIGLKDGVLGAVIVIHTFGEYLGKFHPHLHIFSTDGLFNHNGTFYVMRDVDLKPLEDIFRAMVFKMLKNEGKINDELIDKLMAWRHSGFSVHNKVRIEKDDEEGRERVAQYIMRNAFALDKITYIEDTGNVIYQSKMQKGKNKKNFEVFTAEEFIAAITQHIPDKGFQMTRYYGFYSNRARGDRDNVKKEKLKRTGDYPELDDVEIIDTSEYEPKKTPSKTWRDLIKKIWEVDPLICPKCSGNMKIISCISKSQQPDVVKKILEHLDLWEEPSRAPPEVTDELIYEAYEEEWPVYEDPFITLN